ncbi:MAG: hypothetical protein EAY75_10165 [Bacteroidetes bacterium]|nr:MAG: hypothetical protein EAY75_10165 [Bacteroidota bacterium]
MLAGQKGMLALRNRALSNQEFILLGSNTPAAGHLNNATYVGFLSHGHKVQLLGQYGWSKHVRLLNSSGQVIQGFVAESVNRLPTLAPLR